MAEFSLGFEIPMDQPGRALRVYGLALGQVVWTRGDRFEGCQDIEVVEVRE